MGNITARIKLEGKNFEILVDADKALEFRKGRKVSIQDILALDKVFYDIKKGLSVSDEDMVKAFGTTNINSIAEKIIKKGELILPLEYKSKEREEKIKQVIDFLSRNAIDPASGKPHSNERIKTVIEEAGINIENKPVSEQISKIVEKLKAVLPLKLETKRISVKVPAVYTGKLYGMLRQYAEKEEWENDGSLTCIINIPAGLQLEFYDKLNAVTHGAAITEEVK